MNYRWLSIIIKSVDLNKFVNEKSYTYLKISEQNNLYNKNALMVMISTP